MCPRMQRMEQLDTLRERLRRFTTQEVADASNLSERTVRRIRDGIFAPRMATFAQLEDGLKAVEAARAAEDTSNSPAAA